MMKTSTLTASAERGRSTDASPSRRSRRTRPAQVVLASALLGLAVAAAACSSDSSPTSSADSSIADGLKAESAGNTQQAIKDFTAATTADPTNAIAYYDLGVVYQQNLNEQAQAQAAYNKAILANPHYKPALFNQAILESSSNPQGAITLYNQLLALNPNDANVNFNLGLLLLANNQAAQGHVDLKKAIQIDPSLAKRLPAGVTP